MKTIFDPFSRPCGAFSASEILDWYEQDRRRFARNESERQCALKRDADNSPTPCIVPLGSDGRPTWAQNASARPATRVEPKPDVPDWVKDGTRPYDPVSKAWQELEGWYRWVFLGVVPPYRCVRASGAADVTDWNREVLVFRERFGGYIRD